MLRLLTLLLSCVAVCAQPVLSLNDPTVVAKSSSLLKGLVGWWQLEESSGTRYDRSPNGNHLTSNNSVGSAAGKVGDAGSFVAASSQWLNRSDNPSLRISTNMFLSCWIKPVAVNSIQAIISKNDGTLPASEFLLYINGGTSKITFDIYQNVSTVKCEGSTLSADTWYHIMAWCTGSSIAISVNNGTASTTACSSDLNGSSVDFIIGARSSVGSRLAFGGLIDEVGVWNRTLTTSERTQLYRSGLGVTYPRFSMRDADDFNWDTWQPLYDRPKPFPTLYAFVNRRKPELLSLCE